MITRLNRKTSLRLAAAAQAQRNFTPKPLDPEWAGARGFKYTTKKKHPYPNFSHVCEPQKVAAISNIIQFIDK